MMVAHLQTKHLMTKRLELLCAELRAIDYWEWHYRRATTPRDSDDLSHELRQERREQIVSEIQVIFAKSRVTEKNFCHSHVGLLGLEAVLNEDKKCKLPPMRCRQRHPLPEPIRRFRSKLSP